MKNPYFTPTPYRLSGGSIFIRDFEIPIKTLTKAEDVSITEAEYPQPKKRNLLGYVTVGWLMPTKSPTLGRIQIKYRSVAVRLHFGDDFRTIRLWQSPLFERENYEIRKAIDELKNIREYVEKYY